LNASPNKKGTKAVKKKLEGLKIKEPPSPCKTFVSWGACHITLDWAQKRRIKPKPEASKKKGLVRKLQVRSINTEKTMQLDLHHITLVSFIESCR
jgi:hypothetical protein